MLDQPPIAPEETGLKPPAALLLDWFDVNARDLPWRMGAAPGTAARRDPYRVWLSEIMLQQTTVTAVIPYFEAFLARWPRVEDLGRADLDEVLIAWAGLGYYARARNLHKCARHVADRLGGRFPDTSDALLELPGVGPYTAGAIAAIAFGRAVPAVDGNVIRVLSRLGAIATPLPKAKDEVTALMAGLLPPDRPGDFAEALMDLGASVCTPRRPDCGACPWSGRCRGFAGGAPDAYPKRAPKKEKPTRRGVAFWAVRDDGAVLLQKRPEKGLLGGMMELPGSDWVADFPGPAEMTRVAPFAPVGDDWQVIEGMVRHTFTHFHLELKVAVGRVGAGAATNGLWCQPRDFGAHALPTVMKKVVELAQKHDT